MRSRDGYALLTVLWFLSGSIVLGTAAMFVARGHQTATSNRAALIRAEWRAEACVAAARAAMTEVLRRPGRAGALAGTDLAPRSFRDEVLLAPVISECPGEVEITPFGMQADLNSISEGRLVRTLVAFGIPSGAADSLAAALMDWRDEDDEVRPNGAEREWYATSGRRLPRNGTLADPLELRSVRGFIEWMGQDESSGIATLFTVERGRVNLDAAPAAILRGLPGMSDVAVEAILVDRSQRQARIRELLAIMSVIPESERPAISRAFVELGDAATVATEGWTLSARSSGVTSDAHADRLAAEIELRLVPEGGRFAITRRRFLP